MDYGKARTGIAVTDDAAIIASPLETVGTADLQARLDALIKERPCAGIVVGDPGQITDSSAGIEALLKALHRDHPALPVHRVDESFTSREARQALVEGGMRKSKREQKGSMDRVAAALILQRFLDGPSERSPLPDFSGLRRPKR